MLASRRAHAAGIRRRLRCDPARDGDAVRRRHRHRRAEFRLRSAHPEKLMDKAVGQTSRWCGPIPRRAPKAARQARCSPTMAASWSRSATASRVLDGCGAGDLRLAAAQSARAADLSVTLDSGNAAGRARQHSTISRADSAGRPTMSRCSTKVLARSTCRAGSRSPTAPVPVSPMRRPCSSLARRAAVAARARVMAPILRAPSPATSRAPKPRGVSSSATSTSIRSRSARRSPTPSRSRSDSSTYLAYLRARPISIATAGSMRRTKPRVPILCCASPLERRRAR
jgi:hypothetical protein